MAQFAYVQNNINGASGVTSLGCSLTGVTAGSLIVVYGKHENGSSVTMTASDGTSTLNNDDPIQCDPGGVTCGRFFYLLSANSGNKTYTVTYGTTVDFARVACMEYTYVGTASYDASNRANGTDTTLESGNITTTGTDEVVFAAYGENSVATLTSPQINGASAHHITNLDYLTAMWSSTFTATFTGQATATNVGSNWTGHIIAFKATTVALEQEGFAFGDDDNNEAGHTLGTQDANHTGAVGTKTLRMLTNATGAGSFTPTLRYQKNGSGGYVYVSTNTITDYNAGAVEDGDITKSGNNTATTSWGISVPATGTGDLIIVNLNWDDSTTTTDVAISSGLNGEAPTVIAGPIASASTAVRSKAWYFVTTANWPAGTIVSTPTASEQWTATVIKVPSGEFNSSTPLGVTASTANVSVGNPCCPAFTTGGSDARGRVVCYLATYVNDPDGTASGWTSLTGVDRGAVGDEVEVRNALAGNSESIPYTCGWTVPTATNWTSIAYVIKPKASENNQAYISASANVASGGENTTYRLSAPSGKSTADFVTGRRWDDENGSDPITITTDDYTEVEWVISIQSPATSGDYFDFRVYNGETAFSTYTYTPRWTIGDGGGASGGFMRRRLIF